ncbi:MAG: lysophospholipase [Candidatus Margulisbacteria bacterium]|nr:lysophospholipase [Candidatus Margulisiibacteriota bacterium]MBU1617478.1 lysophospholipase [Candidatus Margulisiibacteriota bacterium]
MPELIGNDPLYRKWTADNARAVFLLVHGMGAHSARWDFLGEYVAGNGYSSYAIELKGFGRTPERPRGHIDSFDTYYQDILNLREIIAKENPGKKIYLLGESLGGLLAFNVAGQYPEKFAGQVLISPAFQNGMKFSLSAYLTLITYILIDPKKTVEVPFTSAMCTRDVAYQKVMDGNPDELRVASLKMLLNTLFAQMKAKSMGKKLTVPSLFLISGRDLLIDEKTGKKIIDSFPLKEKTTIEYPEMLHALSIDLGREKVFADILSWLEKL